MNEWMNDHNKARSMIENVYIFFVLFWDYEFACCAFFATSGRNSNRYRVLISCEQITKFIEEHFMNSWGVDHHHNFHVSNNRKKKFTALKISFHPEGFVFLLHAKLIQNTKCTAFPLSISSRFYMKWKTTLIENSVPRKKKKKINK